jgi:hypothetical protein
MVVNDPVVDLLQRARLSIPLQRVLGRAAEEFERNGTWVTFDQLAYDAADQNLPSPMNELHHLPRALGGAWPGESVSLTGLGLLAAGTAPQTAQLMARLAQICAERKRRLRDDAHIGRLILETEYSFTPQEASRARDLLSLMPGISGGGNVGDDWLLSIHRGALDYRDVHDVQSLGAALVANANIQPTIEPIAGVALVTPDEAPVDGSMWRAGELRLFLSHLAAHKVMAGDVARELSALGMHAFVAHDDIEVSREWQDEIERALTTMHAFVGLMHPDFSKSFWTQQELGWALGRGVPILMVRLGEDPTGFPNRWQALTPRDGKATNIARSIAVWLTQQDIIGPAALDSLVSDLLHARSFIAAREAATRFEEMGVLPPSVLDRLAEAYQTNDQLYPNHVGAQILERIFIKHRRPWPPPATDSEP